MHVAAALGQRCRRTFPAGVANTDAQPALVRSRKVASRRRAGLVNALPCFALFARHDITQLRVEVSGDRF